MADVQLADGQNLGNRGDIVNGKAVSGIHHQPHFAAEMGAVFNTRQLLRLFGCGGGIGIGAGVQLNHRRAHIAGGLDLCFIGINKQRHADACLSERVGKIGHALLLRQHIKPAFGGHFGALFRHQTHILRHHFQRIGQHFIGERHFQIHARFDGGADGEHVVVADMAAVFTQMQGNQIGAVGFGQKRRFQRAGIHRAACIAHGGNMVDIHTE